MVARRYGKAPPLRRLGTIRYADFRRNDDAFFRGNPETVRQLKEAMRELKEGRGMPATLEEIRAMLGLAQ
jgi:hypothetical protein